MSCVKPVDCFLAVITRIRLFEDISATQDPETKTDGSATELCRWSIEALAYHYRIRQQRVMAIVGLKVMQAEKVQLQVGMLARIESLGPMHLAHLSEGS